MTNTPTPAATTDAEVVNVEQCDRDAAAAFHRHGYRNSIELGVFDHNELVQAFARHRLAATPPSSAPALEGLRERLRSLLEARRAAKTGEAAETFTHEIGLLVAGEPETFLAALASSTQLSTSPPSSTKTPDRIKSGDTLRDRNQERRGDA